jgi:hypothetical protein
MSSAAADTDRITRAEAARVLGCSVSRLSHGWGPAPLPGYTRPVYYSRRVIQEFYERLVERSREATQWDSISAKAQRRGGVASKLRGTRSGGRLARQIAEQLRRSSDDTAPSSSARHLVAVPAKI